MAKVDMKRFPFAKNYMRGSLEDDEVYYTNSIHLRADAPVDLVKRIQTQSKFHRLIESGAMIHAFVGEQQPPWQSIAALVRKTFDKTNAAQLTISPEFTVCAACSRTSRGLHEACPECESTEVTGMTRIVGYFSRVTNWNKSKIGELKDRQKGDYMVLTGPEEPTDTTRRNETPVIPGIIGAAE
jgi:ribonucleoside-triphosphate reductase